MAEMRAEQARGTEQPHLGGLIENIEPKALGALVSSLCDRPLGD